MADIVLAECRGQAWLVSGEQYIDDLLMNTLPPEISIELVPCESKSEVDALWVQLCGPPADFKAPWLIHPGVVNRVRRSSGGHGVFFSQWSAMLDEEARAAVRAAALVAAEAGDAEVRLILYVPPGGASALADLAGLRASLVEAQLKELGVAPARLAREVRDTASVPGMGEESQRIDIKVGAA